MPLAKALIEAPLSSGLNQEADSRSLAVDGAAVMQNCVRTKAGAIRKRLGSKQLTNTMRKGAINVSEFASVRGVNYGASPLHFDGFAFSQYSDQEALWTLIDSTPEAVALDQIPVASMGQGAGFLLGSDIAYAPTQKYYITTYSANARIGTSGTTYAGAIDTVITDATSGAVVQPALAIETFGGVDKTVVSSKVIVCGNFAIVSWLRFDTGVVTLYLSRLDLTNINAGWTFPLMFDTLIVALLASYDISPMNGDATRFALAYSAGSAITTKAVTVSVASLTAINTFTNVSTGAAAIGFVAIKATTAEQCWVAYSVFTATTTTVAMQAWTWNDTTNVKLAHVTWGSVPSGTIGYNQVAIARLSSTASVVFYSSGDDASSNFTSVRGQQVAVVAGAVATVGVEKRTPGVLLCSKPVVLTTAAGVRCYAMVIVPSSLQGTQVLVCFDWFGVTAMNAVANAPARLVATISPRLAKALGKTTSPLTWRGPAYPFQIVATSTTTIATLSQINTSLERTGIFIQPFDFKSQLRFFGNTLAGSFTLGLSAGAPFTYDGQVPVEMGFLYYPEFITTALSAGAMTGVFSFIFTYEWVDAGGNIHQSATSPPVTVTLAAQQVTFTIPTLGITWRQRPIPAVYAGANLSENAAQKVKIGIYATIANGTVYYFKEYIDNDTSTSSVSYVATSGGTTTNRLLYTTGGVLDNYIPPSARICVTHKNRFFLSGCDDPTVIWPSKSFTFGEVPGFNEQMNIFASGAVTAMASMDEKLIVFVRRGNNSLGIEYIVGEGPFDTGAGNDFTNPPQPVPSAVGAIDQRSIAVCQIGCVFMSPIGAPNGGGGIYLLSRDLQVHYISGPVEDLIAANPVCNGVVVHPNNNLIYFEMTQVDAVDDDAHGVRLVYDYVNQCWSSDTHWDFNLEVDTMAARTTWVSGGLGARIGGAGSINMPLVYWSDVLGNVYRETSGVLAANAYVDVSAIGSPHWVTATFTSAWFKPALAGFARFWRVQIQSDRLDPAFLGMSFQFDYAPASVYTELNQWTATQIAAFDRAPQVDVEHLVGNQKAKAIQVTLQDAQPAEGYTTGQGFQWATISLEVGVEQQGRYMNLPSGQRG